MFEPAINPGRMKHKVLVVNHTTVQGPTGEEVVTWEPGRKLTGYLRPREATEQEIANQVQIAYTHELIVWYLKNVKIERDSQRIVYYPKGYLQPLVNEYYSIFSVQNVEEDNNYLLIKLIRMENQVYA